MAQDYLDIYEFINFINNRHEYEFLQFSNRELIDLAVKRRYLNSVKKIYSFYDNHTDIDIERPEDWGIKEEDIIRHYYEIEFTEIKKLSKILKYNSYVRFIPNDICKKNFDNKILQYPIFSLFILLYVIWVMVIFAMPGRDPIFLRFLGCLFGSIPFFVSLSLTYLIIQAFFIFMYKWRVSHIKTRKTRIGQRIELLRQRQIDCLIEKN